MMIIYLQIPLQLVCLCVCVSVCVYVSHAFRHFRSDCLANRLILFLSTTRILWHILVNIFRPPPPPRSKNGPKRSFVQPFCRLHRAFAQRCSERPRSARAALAGLRRQAVCSLDLRREASLTWLTVNKLLRSNYTTEDSGWLSYTYNVG